MPKTKTRKPGPKVGDNRVTVDCPYCGGKAHRKAVQNIKGVGAYRRHYCVDGCGHYHYRTPDTNEIVEIGQPRECRIHTGSLNDEIKRLKAELIRANKANEGNHSHDPIGEIATTLGIDPASLKFTSEVDGRPRAIVLCLSDADIEALPTQEDRNTVRQLHQALLTVQACIKTYREQVTKKNKK